MAPDSAMRLASDWRVAAKALCPWPIMAIVGRFSRRAVSWAIVSIPRARPLIIIVLVWASDWIIRWV